MADNDEDNDNDAQEEKGKREAIDLTTNMSVLHSLIQKKCALHSYEGYVHQINIAEVQGELQSDDFQDIVTYVCPDDLKKIKQNEWKSINDNHKFWADKKAAMYALKFDKWILNASSPKTKNLLNFAMLALDDSVMISCSADDIYSNWEDES